MMNNATRVTVDLSPADYERLEKLKAELEANSKAEALRRAIRRVLADIQKAAAAA